MNHPRLGMNSGGAFRLWPRKNGTWMLIAAALLITAVWLFFYQRPQLHVQVIAQAGESLRIAFLRQAPASPEQCDQLARKMAQAMLTRCPNCRIVVSRCLDELDHNQRELLSGVPLANPVIRIPGGVVEFLSDKRELATELCRLSERQAAAISPVHCIAAGVASAALPQSSTGGWPPDVSGSTGTIFAFAFAALMSLLTAWLVLRRRSAYSGDADGLEGTGNTSASSRYRTASQVAKRCLDLLLATSLVVILAPVWLLAALLIFLLEGRPVFYISRRYISATRAVPVLKFRTMVRDATHPRHRLEERFMRDGFLDIPITCEIYTPIGRLLERTQLVETPQLLNIIFHGMSFVGNRPLPANNIERLRESFSDWAERFACPAGITGIAQVVGRRNLKPHERIELESLYARVYREGRLLMCDITIIFFTAWVVLFADGITISKAKSVLRRCLGQ